MSTLKISHFRILEKLGSGGMGEVFRAEDITLGRQVALKFLPEKFSRDAQAVERFRREARAISALNHPNICTIYETGESDGQYFIAMELLDGQTLRSYLNSHSLDGVTIIDLAYQIADALDAAHSRGVIHRDIKPENIIVTARGQIKILDFGLAKLTEAYFLVPEIAGFSAFTTASALDSLTTPGTTPGTVAYMSPEQLRGEPVEATSDLFSFGSVLYEMATGRRPFGGETYAAIIHSILHSSPVPVAAVNREIPPQLDRIISRALEKDPAARFLSAADMRAQLGKLRQDLMLESAGAVPVARMLRKPRVLVPTAIVLLLAVGIAGFWYRQHARLQWLREKAAPEILSLAMQRRGMEAYRLIKQAERFAPNDPALAKVKAETLWPNGVVSNPPGADVYVRDYADVHGNWDYLGKTPLTGNRLPHAFYAFRLMKQGFEPVEATGTALESTPVHVILDPVGTLPQRMVRVPAGRVDPTGHAEAALDTFLIDKYEVTNREYKKFVDAGGYRNPGYWEFPVVKDGHKLDFQSAMALFRDKTDRPGPSTWELGRYPAGEEDYPVSGVSWYEAAAYAKFVGKSLPTVFHWYRAADLGRFSDILQTSNFSGKGPAKVGAYPSLGPFGTYDMAGNVKEWCMNSVGDRRYILGGASTDRPYMYQEPDARSPLERLPTHGFRLMKYLGNKPLPSNITGPISFEMADYSKVKPVPDSVFRIYQSLYSYDQTPLNAKIEGEDDSSPYWRKQRITFDAAYANERVIAYLFLPKTGSPPFQTIVYFPHGGAQAFHTVEDNQLSLIDFLVRSGRALMFPIYKNTYERLTTAPNPGTSAERDDMIQQAKDLRRSIDYLMTRDDIDHQRLAYYGISWGGMVGPIMTSMEPRFKAAIFASGGCDTDKVLPEIDPMNYAPRVKTPVLMINGRYDFVLPLETCQEPFFRQLGSAPQDKKHVLYDTGHAPPQLPVMKESLDWLDHYLGSVK